MKTTIQELEHTMVVTFEGEFDTAAAVEAEQMMQPLYTPDGKDVIVDCEKLEYIASSGLRILLGILKGAKAANHKVTFRKVNDEVKSVFIMTGLIDLFEIEQ